MAAGKEAPHRTTISIDNEEYVLRSEEAGEYMQRLAALVDGHMQRLRQRHPNLARNRAAILAALYLADELEKAKQENAELLQTLREAR